VYRFVVDDSLWTNVNFDVSVNGDLVYDGLMSGETHLRFRRAADTVSAEIPGTRGGLQGSFSPDGEWIVFGTQGEGLKKVQVGTGTVVSLVSDEQFEDAAMPHWADDGTIVFISGSAQIYRVPSVGGIPEQIGELMGFTPQLLPDLGGVKVGKSDGQQQFAVGQPSAQVSSRIRIQRFSEDP